MTASDPDALASDERALVAAFRAATLGDDAFHHRDHVRMAWIYVRTYGLEAAVMRFTDDLRAFAAAKGVPRLYHATITVAYLTLVAERLGESPGESWTAFAAAHPDLLAWKPSILDGYYSAERLWSETARARFVLPDRVPTQSSPAYGPTARAGATPVPVPLTNRRGGRIVGRCHSCACSPPSPWSVSPSSPCRVRPSPDR